jgi:hypothetical protein
LRAVLCVLWLALASCTSTSAPERPQVQPVAVASIEVRTMEAGNPDPDFDATCQTGAAVLLKATGSHDPAGRTVTYEWSDAVEGVPTADLMPRTNPFRTSEIEVASGFYTIGYHDVTLTVTASDGRKSSTTLRVKVTGCDC